MFNSLYVAVNCGIFHVYSASANRLDVPFVRLSTVGIDREFEFYEFFHS